MSSCSCDELPQCGDPWGCANITASNAQDRFPGLDVSPSPEPDKKDKKKWEKWYQGYQKWGKVKCACGNGYFCKRHGEWIPGHAVTQKLVPPRDRQDKRSCRPVHGEQRYGNEREHDEGDSELRQKTKTPSTGKARESQKSRSDKSTAKREQRSGKPKDYEQRQHHASTSKSGGKPEDQYRGSTNPWSIGYSDEYFEEGDRKYAYDEPSDGIPSGSSYMAQRPRTVSSYGSSGDQAAYLEAYQDYDDPHGLTSRVGKMSLEQTPPSQHDEDEASNYYSTTHHPRSQTHYTTSYSRNEPSLSDHYQRQHYMTTEYHIPEAHGQDIGHYYPQDYEGNPEHEYAEDEDEYEASPSKDHKKKKSKSHSSKKEGKHKSKSKH